MLRSALCIALLVLSNQVFAVGEEFFATGFETAIEDPDDGECSFEVQGPGPLTNDTVWVDTPRYCDYLLKRPSNGVNAPVLQLDGATLTIEPGVVVRFEQGMTISVLGDGAIDAVGTELRRIRFEGAEPSAGFADGIFLAADSLLSRFEYVDFVDLGSESALVGDPDGALDGHEQAGGVVLRRSSVSGSAFDGISLDSLRVMDFARNEFTNNQGYALRIGGDQLSALDGDSNYIGGSLPNTRPFVYAQGVFDPVVEPVIWRNLGAPVFVSVALYIDPGGAVTIEPGAQFTMDQGASIRVADGGVLRAIGTEQSPIVFSGESPAPGYWDSIRFLDSPGNNLLRYVQLSGGGGSSFAPGNIYVDAQSKLTVQDSEISDSANFGVCQDFGAELDIDANTEFTNNPMGDVGVNC